MPRDSRRPEAVREGVPLLPLRGVIVFPCMTVPLEVGRDRSVAAVEEAMIGNRLVMLASQKQARLNEPTPADIFSIGTLAEIRQMARYPDGTIRVLVEGLERARILEYTQAEPFYKVRVEDLRPFEPMTKELEALMRAALTYFESYVRLGKKVPAEILSSIQAVQDPGRLADDIAAHLPLRPEDKQSVLEAVSVTLRLERLCAILLKEIEILELERKINTRVRKQMERTQKEYYLREQMKAIQKELGERDERQSEAEEYLQKIKEKGLPDEAEEKAIREVERLEKMPPMAAEAVVVRTYIDWLLALPWSSRTEDRLDLPEAARILDEDHYGLEKVKERILEFLAVRRLTSRPKGPILCFVGPPGVGKTSLGKSIARALGREFVRFSLGGVRDEAEIRGHRRTYVGALPGRIIQAMRQASSKNPVILLDEVDKMSSDFRGDPASALLEVLDPEQNATFSDHYIEVPYDLSDVMFITTANLLYSIPRPLLDRMEIINIPGYTEEEKIIIARDFLVPKQKKENGLDEYNVSITDDALRAIIRNYTREAGVRGLERGISSILRKIARKVVSENLEDFEIIVDENDVLEYLGVPKYRYGVAESQDRVGVATGLAVTEAGGDILAIEVSVMKGTGKLTLTGKLGDVMKESAQAAFTYIRSRAVDLDIDPEFYQNYDVHVHVPEGAIPKDGPSAGIAMAIALASALTKRAVRCDVAMTGEITLRGRVLAVGGIKEKVLAAHRAGIFTVILPDENKREVEEIPANVRDSMELIFVDHMDEVLEFALRKEADGYEKPTKEDFPEMPTTPPDDSPAIGNELYCN
ncbi:MAG: endopeptidase La [Bacillota bacterium]|jgi:ATP-dependent Lon protease|nr:endopeptidase La [Bacillota bacterium]MDI9414640.1 endopeptidase La [Bacillota bacterium]NLD12242.1 endopeptidase La [Bacillota bacterium]HOB87999.1 endopeptidase La [Bacillota bacterium]HOJ57010.1 endopeptidase La [Bacillota bacterium]